MFENEKYETSTKRKSKRNRRGQEKQVTTKSQNSGDKRKQTLNRRKCDHSETEETSSNIHETVSSKDNTDEDDKTTKTDAVLDNNNHDVLINGEKVLKGLNTCSSETEAVPDGIHNDSDEVSESVVITGDENGGGDDLDNSPRQEKHIHTPEGSVHDVIKRES